MPLVAGINMGRSACAVTVAYAGTGEIERQGYAEYPAENPAHPAGWWRSMLDAINEVGGFADVRSWSLSGALDGLIALDADGLVISSLVDDAPMLELLARLRASDADVADRTEAALIPRDWLLWRLRGYGPFGEMPNGPRLEELVTSRADASRTGFWDAATGRWLHDRFDEALGVPAIKSRIMKKPDAWGGESQKNPDYGIRSNRIIGIGLDALSAVALATDAKPGQTIVWRTPEGAAHAAYRLLSTDAGLELLSQAGQASSAATGSSAAGGSAVGNSFTGELAAVDSAVGGSGAGDSVVGGSATGDGRQLLAHHPRLYADGTGAFLQQLEQAPEAPDHEIVCPPLDPPKLGDSVHDWVGRGAAAQAAWSLTHRRPHWT